MPIPIPGRTVEALRRSTVFIASGRRNRTGTGSGIVLANDTLVTNAHVIGGGDLTIESWEGKTARSTVLKVDNGRDLALLHAPGLGAPPASLADSDLVRPGTPVVAVGNPLGFKGAVSTGTVHTLEPVPMEGPSRRSELNPLLFRRWIYADVRLAPGNSGGPLADWEGRVIGINTMVVSGGLALAIPSSVVQAFLARMKRPSLGVTLRPVHSASYGFGLLILEVVPDSPAARASLLPGDILAGANEKQFRYVDDLEILLEEHRDPLLTVQFHRGGDGKERRVAVQLARGPVTTAA
jgi:serine protease Do